MALTLAIKTGPCYKTLLENIWYFVLHSTKYHPIFVLTNRKGMKSKFVLSKFFLIPVILIAAINLTSAQSKKDSLGYSILYKEIAHMDSVLFDAYNSHNVDKLNTLFTDDLEFYHDLGGLSNHAQNMEAFKNNFAKNEGLRRDLVQGSLEVYPVKDYGAIEIGAHSFCHIENGRQDCGTFKFVMIWQKKDAEWKISRVVSYGH